MRLHWRARHPRDSRNKEHPLVALLGLAAIVAAVLAIVWLRVAYVGTKDVQRALAMEETQTPIAPAKKPHSLRRKAEDAAAQSRWATGFSH
jgi:negative regulator of sigma E activity